MTLHGKFGAAYTGMIPAACGIGYRGGGDCVDAPPQKRTADNDGRDDDRHDDDGRRNCASQSRTSECRNFFVVHAPPPFTQIAGPRMLSV